MLGCTSSMDFTLPPATSRFTFGRAEKRYSEPILLAEGAHADRLGDCESLQLRVGLVDKRAGRLDRGFLGQLASGPAYDAGGEWGSGGHSEDESDMERLDDSDLDISDSDEYGGY